MSSDATIADAWADRAIAALAGVTDMARWIVANCEHIGRCEAASADAVARVRAAIAVRWDEIEGRRIAS